MCNISWVVNIKLSKLKKIAVLAATIIVLSFIWNNFVKYRPWDIRIPVKKDISGPDYAFTKIKVKEISGATTFFDIHSDQANFYKNHAVMINVSGNILTKNKPVMFIKSDNMQLSFKNQNGNLTNFFGQSLEKTTKRVRRSKHSRRYKKITIYQPVWNIKSHYARWNHKHKTITLFKPLKIWKQGANITADKLTYYSYYQLHILEPNCHYQDQEYEITSKKIILKEKLKIITFEKDIEIKGPDYNGRADFVDINYKKNEYILKDNVIIEYEDAAINTALATAKLKSNIINFTDGIKLRYKNLLVQSNKAKLNRDLKIIEFQDNIKAYHSNSLIEGQKMIYDLKEKQFISTGGRTKYIKSKNND